MSKKKYETINYSTSKGRLGNVPDTLDSTRHMERFIDMQNGGSSYSDVLNNNTIHDSLDRELNYILEDK